MDRVISNRYAQALFSVAVEKNAVEEYEQSIRLICDVISADNELMKILTHPDITGEEKLNIMTECFKSTVGDDIMGLFSVIISKNREKYIPEILEMFIEKAREYEGKCEAVIESARELSDGKIKEIESRLSNKLNKQVTAKCLVCPELLGGMRIKVDGHIIDKTVKRQIDDMKRQMLA